MTKNYDIGYGRPPQHTRWTKGQSGNLKGRPRKDAKLGALLAARLAESVVVRQGRRMRRMTRLEHLLDRLLEQALAGDARLIKLALDETRLAEARSAEARDASEETLDNPADREVVAALIARLTGARDVTVKIP